MATGLSGAGIATSSLTRDGFVLEDCDIFDRRCQSYRLSGTIVGRRRYR
jgi:hypothetical protein